MTQVVDEDIGTDEGVAHAIEADSQARPRFVLVHVLVVLAAVLLLVTATNVWVKRQMLDTDNWVATSDQLLADQETRARLSVFLVDELYASVDVAGQLQQQLPDQLAGLAASVAAGLRETAVDLVDRLLASPQAQEIWARANRRAHETFVAIVRDDTRASVSTADGTVTLDLREIVLGLAERLGLSGSAIERIPEDVGQVVLLESDQLAEIQDVVSFIEWAGIALFFIIILLIGTAVALAQGWRRHAIRLVGMAILIDSLLILLLLRVANRYLLENYVAVPANRLAVANTYGIATTLLGDLARTGVLLGAMTIIATVLVGPSRPALALRRKLGPSLIASPGAVWAVVVLLLLALAIWTPFNIVSTWLGLLAAVSIAVATVVAFQWACEHERAPAIIDTEPRP